MASRGILCQENWVPTRISVLTFSLSFPCSLISCGPHFPFLYNGPISCPMRPQRKNRDREMASRLSMCLWEQRSFPGVSMSDPQFYPSTLTS